VILLGPFQYRTYPPHLDLRANPKHPSSSTHSHTPHTRTQTLYTNNITCHPLTHIVRFLITGQTQRPNRLRTSLNDRMRPPQGRYRMGGRRSRLWWI
jgi:hypothetical protein